MSVLIVYLPHRSYVCYSQISKMLIYTLLPESFYCHFDVEVIIGVLTDRFYFGLVIGIIKITSNLLRDKCAGPVLKKRYGIA